MIKKLIYSMMGLGGLVNLAYLLWKGFLTDYQDYMDASMITSVGIGLIMSWHVKSDGLEWNGLKPWGVSGEFKSYLRIGMRCLLILVLMGIMVVHFADLRDMILKTQARKWMSHFVFLLYLGLNTNFILFCIFGDKIIISRSVKSKGRTFDSKDQRIEYISRRK